MDWPTLILLAVITIAAIIIIWYILDYSPGIPVSPLATNTSTGTRLDLIGSTAVRIDGRELLFIGGGINQPDMIMDYVDGMFTPIMTIPKDSPTTCACSGILEGSTESIIVGRFDGVYIIDTADFAQQRIWTPPQAEAPTSVSLGDYDGSGRLSLYIGNYTQPGNIQIMQFGAGHTSKNYLLKNTPDGWLDVTDAAGVAGARNSWSAAFIDLSGSGWPDIVVANDEGEVEIFANNHDGTFSQVQLASVIIGYWMGVAAGDYDGSGRQSLFFTNVGTNTTTFSYIALKLFGTVPEFPEGYTTHHMLLKNNGNYDFDIILTDDSNTFKGGSTAFGWGAIFTDFNLDGRLDLLYSTGWKMLPWNQVAMTRDPGVVFSNTLVDGRVQFKAVNKFKNRAISQTPISLDVNGNGLKDIVWINHFERPKVYTIDPPNKQYINVVPMRTASNSNATITLVHSDGTIQTRQLILGGTGQGTGESNVMQFGVTKPVLRILVTTRNGERVLQESPATNQTYHV